MALEEWSMARKHLARRSEMRTIDRELMTMHIEATDQDQQHCHATDQEVRSEYYSSTPDGLAKDDGGMDADERLRREAINTQYEARQKQIRRLTTHWSDRDLAHLPPEQREAQELEMASVYETFDEKGLDAALASIEHAVPAEAEPSDEPTPEEHEQIVMQVRRRL